MDNLPNSRRSPRTRCSVPIDSKDGTFFYGSETIDISEEGIGLLSDKKIPLDEEIAVEIELGPDGDSVIMMGKVKWIKKILNSGHYRVGMKLTKTL